MNLRFFRYLFLALSLPLVFHSCQSKKPANVTSLAGVNPYIFAYTTGVISKVSPIRIQFSRDVVGPEALSETPKASLLKVTPAISGALSWEDEHTLRFDPAAPMQSGTTYKVDLDLRALIREAEGDDRRFAFEFRTKDQYFQVEPEGLVTGEADPASMRLEGVLLTADVAEPDEVQNALSASLENRDLDLEWSHSADQLIHRFTVKGIDRQNQARELQLSWNGAGINAGQRGKRTLEVPALGDFKVLGVEVLQGNDQYLAIRTSDPLLRNQNLEGLVAISGYEGGFRFAFDENVVRVYPNERLTGDRVLTVFPGIRNSRNDRMPNRTVWQVALPEIKPQVRLVGSGVIMPGSEGLFFPFEAIGLRSVEVEVFRIFHNNILQFLQNNSLEGGYSLQEVGRIMRREKVDLQLLNPEAQANTWTRYALDLSKLMDQDPDAILQIRIGFRPEDALTGCDQGIFTELAASALPIDDLEQSIMDSWYGIYGWYGAYDWDNRDNPCFPEYYNSDRFIRRNIIASNLGIIAKGGNDGSVEVTVTDLRTTDPVSGAEVTLYDYQQQELAQALTDGSGFASLSSGRTPFVAVVRKGNEKGYLRLQDGDALSVSRFDVSGAVTQKGLKGFLYGERGVWRPGDSLFLNFVLEDTEQNLPENYPVQFELFDARGQLHSSRKLAYHLNRVYPVPLATAVDAPTGNWRARINAGGATFEKILKIETVKPNRLKIDLDFGTPFLSGRGAVRGELTSTWLHGAPAAGLEAVVEAQLRDARTEFPRFPSFSFDDPARREQYYGQQVVFENRLDARGGADLNFRLLSDQSPAGMLRAAFRTRVFEAGGDFSTDNFSIPVYPYQAYTGVEIPRNEYDEPRLEVGRSGELRFAAVDREGNPLAGRRLSVGIYRVNWRWWWDSGDDYVASYNSSSHFNASERTELVTNAEGIASWTVTPDQWGRYLVRVCDEEGGHCGGSFLYAGYPWYGDDSDSQRELAAMLSVRADQKTYQVGEEIRLTLPAGGGGRLLVSLENGSKVIDRYWMDAEEGEQEIRLTAAANMAPTTYAHLTWIQPHAQSGNDLPIRMYGIVPLEIKDPATVLEPKIETAAEFKPQSTATIEVSEAGGKAMTYTLALVDEGLLGLTRFRTPNPHEAFYAREALGVKTWDVFDEVLGAYGGQLNRVLSIGGDGAETEGELNNTANRFEPVALHLGPFELKAGKKARHTVAIPNYVGALRVMVVASGERAYGAAEKEVPVRNPLMVLSTLPRVLTPGESLTIPVNVFVSDQALGQVTVNLEETNGLVQFTDGQSRQLNFRSAGDQLVYFQATARGAGAANFRITASGPGGAAASQDIELAVRNPNPYQTEVLAATLDPGETWNQEFTPLGMAGTRSAVLEVSNIPPLNLERRLSYLLRYPYGCLEQTISTGFPQLFVDRFTELSEQDQEEVPRNIQATINRLRSFKTANGGFAYWPGQPNPDQWSTSYAGHFLSEAQALGYSVPSGLLTDWQNFQKKAARLWDPEQGDYGFYSRSNHELNQAYRLYTLALSGAADLASMNRMRETSNLSAKAVWRLAAAYALAGKTEIAREMVQALETQVDPYTEMAFTYGSGERDQAMILETLVLLNDEARAGQVVQDLSNALGRDAWLSTQTTAYALMAIAKFVGDTKVDNDFSFAYRLNRGATVNAGSNRPVSLLDLPEATTAPGALALQNNSEGKLFVRLVLSGQPVPGTEKAGSNDLSLSMRFLDREGNAISPDELVQGQDFQAEVQVRHPGTRAIRYEELALSQVFPSGWEIINTRMDDLKGAEQSTFDYQDIRDDRVNTFFDLRPGETKTFRVLLNAAYAGRYYLPATSCGAMYDQTVSAFREGRWVTVKGFEVN